MSGKFLTVTMALQKGTANYVPAASQLICRSRALSGCGRHEAQAVEISLKLKACGNHSTLWKLFGRVQKGEGGIPCVAVKCRLEIYGGAPGQLSGL